MSKSKKSKELTATEEVMKQLKPIADALGVAVTSLWKIFVRRWFAKGASQMFVAIVVALTAIAKLGTTDWVYLPLGVALLISYNAINLLINPQYFALGDIMQRLKEATKDEDKELSTRRHSGIYC